MGKYIVHWWIIVLLNLLSLAGQAQSTVLYFNEPPKETLGRNKNQLVINKFFNDRDDFLWFISGNGLNRYDGHEVVTIRSNPVDLNSLSSSQVVDMIQDEQGNFWITTRDGGLNAYNPQTGKIVHFRHVPTNKASLSSDKLRFLQRDESGQLWIGSDLGVNQFDPKTGRTVRFMPKPGEAGQLQGNPLSPIVVESEKIYVSTTVGFECYNRVSKQWHCFPAVDKQGCLSPTSWLV